MADQERLTKEAFLRMAAAAGLDVNSPHMEELYPTVLNLLANLGPLREIDVAGTEPDMAFLPSPE